jgi:hypothetical protein
MNQLSADGYLDDLEARRTSATTWLRRYVSVQRYPLDASPWYVASGTHQITNDFDLDDFLDSARLEVLERVVDRYQPRPAEARMPAEVTALEGDECLATLDDLLTRYLRERPGVRDTEISVQAVAALLGQDRRDMYRWAARAGIPKLADYFQERATALRRVRAVSA